MARDMGAEHVVCTELESGGRADHRPPGHPAAPGAGQGQAVRALATRHDLDLAPRSLQHGDEDVTFLETVGNPVAVQPQAGMAGEAARRGWPCCAACRVARRPGPTAYCAPSASTAGFAAAVGPGSGWACCAGRGARCWTLTTALRPPTWACPGRRAVEVLGGAEY